MFWCDIAYSLIPAASRASARSPRSKVAHISGAWTPALLRHQRPVSRLSATAAQWPERAPA